MCWRASQLNQKAVGRTRRREAHSANHRLSWYDDPVAHDPALPSLNTRLLEALVSAGVITSETRDAAVSDAVVSRAYVEDVLVDRGLVPERRLLSFAANLDKVFFLSTKKLCTAPIDRDLLARVDGNLAHSLCIFPVQYRADRGELVVATVQPTDREVLDRIQSAAVGVSTIVALLARPSAIRAMITRHYALPVAPPPSRRGPPN